MMAYFTTAKNIGGQLFDGKLTLMANIWACEKSLLHSARKGNKRWWAAATRFYGLYMDGGAVAALVLSIAAVI